MTQLEIYLARLQRFGIRPGLERVRALLTSAGEPQRNHPVILIGGTNGKGSTCEFLARTLARDGLKVGLYTSPHLYKWNERIRVLTAETLDTDTAQELFPGIISDQQLDELFHAAQPHLQSVATDSELGQPTEFETLTFLGLWHFARASVDVAVVEVGLGGRWDATNVTEPTVSVVTHVALDHCDRLGSTVEEIARDKVEIARPQRVLVTAETKPQVLDVFQAKCVQSGARLWPFFSPTWSTDRLQMEKTLAPLQLHIEAQADDMSSFQQINRATALVARAAFIRERPNLQLAPVAPQIEYSVPGRLEVLQRNPTVVIDGANNPDGAMRLAAQLPQLVGDCGGRLILVLGILADKDYRAMIATLAPLAHTVIATQSDSPRAAEAATIAHEASTFCQQVEAVTPVNVALKRALDLAQPNDVVCVTGSFYTIAEVNRQ